MESLLHDLSFEGKTKIADLLPWQERITDS